MPRRSAARARGIQAMQPDHVKPHALDARHCLRNMSANNVASYLRGVYGSAPPDKVAGWRWGGVDIIWLDLLDDWTTRCLLSHQHDNLEQCVHSSNQEQVGGCWVAHRNVGFYLPPIGSKMQYPVIWQYRHALRCAGSLSEFGGVRGPPKEFEGKWIEVFHYFGGLGTHSLEASNVWLYRTKGSGTWYYTGRMLAFSDTADLANYLRLPTNLTKGKLIKQAQQALGRHVSTLAFTHHVDHGYAKQRVCSAPGAGFSTVYYYQYELIVLNSSIQQLKRCPPLRGLRSGWSADDEFKPCNACESFVEPRSWQSVFKARDERWQLKVMRCARAAQARVKLVVS
uniref:Uncharacterized protein n=1 Tax=Coccolithus braarudii TaxID=221442 RepID=A0A7S0LGN5_9EUKA|mmetsp:Transcript_39462/g.84103  ORF Transcript_39462/g.84103 Transcript_39462/m.84103 type:complete len:340 (+) Transcript_39462:1-1020(+)